MKISLTRQEAISTLNDMAVAGILNDEISDILSTIALHLEYDDNKINLWGIPKEDYIDLVLSFPKTKDNIEHIKGLLNQYSTQPCEWEKKQCNSLNNTQQTLKENSY